MKNLKSKWISFIGIALDPWTLVLSIGVLLLFLFSIDQTDKKITSLLFVLITAASAILGGRITKHWVDISDGGVVVARGKSAVRSLKLLLRNISALEKRVSLFIGSDGDIKIHPEVTKRNYEEIIAICNVLEEETVNSVENWTDIVPEADIKTQIGLISDLKQQLDGRGEELQSLKNELVEKKGTSEDARKRLDDEVKEKKKQIAVLEKELLDKRIGLGGFGDFLDNRHVGFGISRPASLGLTRPTGLGLHDPELGLRPSSIITDVSGGTNVTENPKKN